MMAGNPNWWGMFPPSLFPPQFPSASLPFASFADLAHHQPQSWSQLLLGDEERLINQTQSHYQPKKSENWEDQILNPSPAAPFVDIVKQEVSNERNCLYAQAKAEESLIQAAASRPPAAAWSCPSTLTPHTDKFLNFSYNNKPDQSKNSEASDLSPESTRSAAGGACKKARVHPPSSSQPPLKVRKEKLVDRITALHQIVSPFGKTDTASVLSEAIGYIRFLQGQIEALSYPYLRSAPKDLRTSQPTLLNDSCLKRKAIPNPNQGAEEMMSQDQRPPLKDLRSRGLCLVPLSCTQLVEGDNNGAAAAYWAPAYGTGF